MEGHSPVEHRAPCRADVGSLVIISPGFRLPKYSSNVGLVVSVPFLAAGVREVLIDGQLQFFPVRTLRVLP